MPLPKENIPRLTLFFRYLVLTVMTLGFIATIGVTIWTTNSYIDFIHFHPRFWAKELNGDGIYQDQVEIRRKGGAVIGDIDSQGVSWRAGLRIGDSIVSVNGEKLSMAPEAFYRPFLNPEGGTKIRYEFIRDGAVKQCTVVLKERYPAPISYLGITQGSDTTGAFRTPSAKGIYVKEVASGTPAEGAGLEAGDIIVKMNGITLENTELWLKLMDATLPSQRLKLEILRNGQSMAIEVILGERPELSSYWDGFIVTGSVKKAIWTPRLSFILLPLLFLIVGALIGWLRPKDSNAFLCSVWFLSAGSSIYSQDQVLLGALPPAVLLAIFSYVEISTAIAIPLTLRVLANFPNRSKLGNIFLKWEWVAISFAGIYIYSACINYIIHIYDLRESWITTNPVTRFLANANEWIMLPIIPIMIVLLIAQRTETRDKPASRLKVIEAGIILSIAGMVIYLLASAVYNILPEALQAYYYYFRWIIPLALFGALPLAFAYTVLTRKVFGLKVIVRKGLQYIFLSKGAFILEGFIVFLIVLQIIIRGGAQIADSPVAVSGLSVCSTLAVLFALGKVNKKLMPAIDRRFFREALDVRKLLQELNEHLSEIREKGKILNQTASTVLKALHPARVVFLLKEANGQELKSVLLIQNEEAKNDENGISAITGSDISLLAGDAIIKHLEKTKSYALVYPDTLNAEKDEDARLLALRCELLIGVNGSAGLVGVMGLGAKLSEEPYSKEDRDLLTTVASEMGLALENAELLEVARREAEFSKELEIARKVQQNLFPMKLPGHSGWEFAGRCLPAKAVGGDYYDIFEAVPGKVVIALGDVSGKGLGASFLMSSVHGSIRIRIESCVENPLKLIDELNRYLLASTSKNMFVTLFFGIIDLEAGILRYVNCGHPPPIVTRQIENKWEKLVRNGPGLSMLAGAKFTQGVCQLKGGDTLAVYSDGVTEAANKSGEMYEEGRLVQLLSASVGKGAEIIMDGILKSVESFASGAEQADDLSVIVVRRK